MNKKLVPLLSGFIIGALTVHLTSKGMKKHMKVNIVDDLMDKKECYMKKFKKMFD